MPPRENICQIRLIMIKSKLQLINMHLKIIIQNPVHAEVHVLDYVLECAVLHARACAMICARVVAVNALLDVTPNVLDV